jgi:hypothetical protein
MDTRAMLYLERGEHLEVLPGIPRRYLEDGKHIEVRNAGSYFGPINLRVDSRLSQDRIDATFECASDRRPRVVELRLPHPQGRKATRASGGNYDPNAERVRIEPFTGHANVTLYFDQSMH